MIQRMYGQRDSSSTSNSYNSVRSNHSIAIAAIGSLAVGGLIDIATGESLSMTENSPTSHVILFRALDLYTSPLGLLCIVVATFLVSRLETISPVV